MNNVTRITATIYAGGSPFIRYMILFLTATE